MLPGGPSAATSPGHAQAGITCGPQQGWNFAFHFQGFVDNLPESQGQRKVMILHHDAGLFSSI